MKNLFLWLIAALFLCVLPTTSFAGIGEADKDKTLSPYFFVQSDDPATDQLPLKSTSAEVTISGVIADVIVRQTYANEGKRPLEAIYVFPASTRAAVYAMKMTIGERTVEAVIKKREEARQDYENAKREGKSASLLEQQRPNVFQMNVANILPGDTVKVELKYTELIVPEDKVYEFVYPTVVGPRYTNQPASGAGSRDAWVHNPYLHQGEAPKTQFDIKVKLAAGLPIRAASVETHKVDIAYSDAATATIKLDPSERFGANRDYILKYRLDGEKITSGLLLHKGEKENFFLLMMEPPKKVALNDIPKREYIFIVDISGSMHGYPLQTSKKLLTDLIGNLRPIDTFNVLLFAGSSSMLAEHSLPATQENIDRALVVIDRQECGGGTELVPALKKALAFPGTEGVSRTVVIATDGYVSVEGEVFDLIRNNLGKSNFFAFGIGTAVNRALIEGMARAGMGEAFVITKPEDAAPQAERFRKMVQSPVLTKIETDFGGFDAYDIEPISVPDVLAERPVIIFGKWRGNPRGTIRLSGITGHGRYSKSIAVEDVKQHENPALRYLWARHKIAALSDYNLLHVNDPRIDEVTELSLKYNLLSAYTSFVAVDNEVRNKGGERTTVKQPLPLPAGVSDRAVGGIDSYAPAPSPMAAPMLRGMAKKSKKAEEPVYGAVVRESAADGRVAKAEDAGSAPTVTIMDISDSSKRSMLEKALRERVTDIRACSSNWSGELKLVLKIDRAGHVTDVAVAPGSGNDQRTIDCLQSRIKKWRLFRKPVPAPLEITIVVKM